MAPHVSRRIRQLRINLLRPTVTTACLSRCSAAEVFDIQLNLSGLNSRAFLRDPTGTAISVGLYVPLLG